MQILRDTRQEKNKPVRTICYHCRSTLVVSQDDVVRGTRNHSEQVFVFNCAACSKDIQISNHVCKWFGVE